MLVKLTLAARLDADATVVKSMKRNNVPELLFLRPTTSSTKFEGRMVCFSEIAGCRLPEIFVLADLRARWHSSQLSKVSFLG